MAHRFLLDTNIVSDVARFPQGIVADRIADVGERHVCTSIVVAAELRYGAARRGSARLSERTEAVLSALAILAFDEPADRYYAELRAHLERCDTPMGPNDMLITAQALASDLTVVSANVDEFSRVPNLRVEIWLDTTVIAAFVAYLGPSVCSLLASWWSAWLLPLPRGLAYPLGGALLVVGLVGYNAARREFRSLRRNWGMRTEGLITTGPYAYSRNPQLMTWGLVLLGAAVAGRSRAALALTATYWVGCVFAIRVEEQALERVFGQEYRRYRAVVPRYMRLPRFR